jgi:hypothetical protein
LKPNSICSLCVDCGEDVLESVSGCIYLKVAGKIYKAACFQNGRDYAGTIDLAGGMLDQKQ